MIIAIPMAILAGGWALGGLGFALCFLGIYLLDD
jgi:hypothetical protein